MGDLLKWVIAGVIGGAIGAALWAGITYGTGYEIGWIAWGIGVVVGIAVRIAAGETDGFGPGIVAALIAVVSICGGKYGASALMTNDAIGKISGMIKFDDNQMLEILASSIAEEQEAAGKKLKWPPGKKRDEASSLADYPATVVTEAKKQWTAKSPAERQQMIDEKKQAFEALTREFAGDIRQRGFLASFSPIDFLFFFLAICSAFKIGAGVTDGE